MMRRLVWLRLLVIGLSTQLSAQEVDSVLIVRNIVVEGNMTTKDYVILREMMLKPGEKLTPSLMERDQRRIYSLQLFNKVDIDYTADGLDATVFVRVSERWYFFPFPIIGFKYRDLKNLYYGAGVIHQNFRGRNEKIFFSGALGYDRWINCIYQNPKLTDGDDIFFRASISYSRARNLSVSRGEYDQIVFNPGISFGKRFGLYQTFIGSLFYDVWSVSDPGLGRTVSGSGRDAFFSVGARYFYDSRDVQEYSTEGLYLMLSLQKYGLGDSDLDLFRYAYDSRAFASLSDNFTLGARSFVSLVSGGIVPPYRQVQFGFSERIRGYFHTELEGENIAGGSVEIRIPLLQPRYYTLSTSSLPGEFRVLRYGLYAGIFADAGRIWYRSEPFSTRNWYSGVGTGLHFLLPYSLIVRTEYAVNNLGKGQFILDFGASF